MLTACCLALWSCLPAAADESSRWALLVGVDDYANVEPLKYCGADMRALAERLVGAGFPQQHVFLLQDKAELTKYRPMKTNIEEQLNLVLSLVQPKDLLVVAFSGHGVHLDGKSYLCPTETRLGSPETMIALDGIYDRLDKCPAAMKLLLVDACRNDPRLQGQRSAVPLRGAGSLGLTLDPPPQGILLLTSCAPGQVSMEEKDFGHGVFMNFVLQGLQGQADTNRDSRVSLVELYKFASDQTKTYVARKFNGYQTPALKGEIHDDFDLTLVTGGPSRPGSGSTTGTTPTGGTSGGSAAGPSDSGEPMIVNSLGMRLIRVPAGEFSMGSPLGEGLDNDRPAHRVAITRPFYLAQTEVTQRQYQTVMGHNPSAFSAGGKAAAAVAGRDTSQWPVESVSHDDALEFCKRLAAMENLPQGAYRLPTEAEWEYAARSGGTPSRDLGQSAWYWDNAERQPHPVAQKTPNALGLYDMAGNVAEWCADWFDASYYAVSAPRDPTGPSAPGASPMKVLRGGHWNAKAAACRPTDRDANSPGYRLNCYGFRVVREASAGSGEGTQPPPPPRAAPDR